MKRSLVYLAVLSFLFVLIPVSEARTGEIARNYDFNTSVRLSRIMDRQFVFTFTSSGCPHCQTFKDNILSDPEVKEMLDDHFVLSLVSVDSSFKLKLPEKGEVTNLELAGGLGIRGTPTTLIFYPPNPGLFDRGITKMPGSPRKPEQMVDLLQRIVTESFKEEEETDGEENEKEKIFNYRPPIKRITGEEFDFLRQSPVELPVVTEKVDLASLPEAKELVIHLPSPGAEQYAEKVLKETEVKKTYLVVEDPADQGQAGSSS